MREKISQLPEIFFTLISKIVRKYIFSMKENIRSDLNDGLKQEFCEKERIDESITQG